MKRSDWISNEFPKKEPTPSSEIAKAISTDLWTIPRFVRISKATQEEVELMIIKILDADALGKVSNIEGFLLRRASPIEIKICTSDTAAVYVYVWDGGLHRKQIK